MEEFDNGKGGKIKFRNSTSELTLEEYTNFAEWDFQISKIESELSNIQALVAIGELTEDDAELEEAQFYIDRDEFILKICTLLVTRTYRNIIKSMSPKDRFLMKSKLLLLEENYEIGIEVKIPGVNTPLIKSLQEQLVKLDKVLHKREIFELKQRIKALSTHKLVCLPVQKAVFAVRMKNDSSRKKISKFPEQLETYLEDNRLENGSKIKAEELGQHLVDTYSESSIEEQKEILKLHKVLREHRVKTDYELIQIIPEILAHLMLPMGEEYNFAVAQSRLPYMKKMRANVALGLINFIYAVLQISKARTALSSMEGKQPMEMSENQLLQSVKNLGKFTAGLESWLSTLQPTQG